MEIKRKPITFYELMCAVLMYCAIVHDPFIWWFVFAPFVYQGAWQFVYNHNYDRWLKRTQKDVEDIVHKGVPEELRKDID